MTALAGTLAFAMAAQANNSTVENALKSRPELSTFYNGLVSTGVLSELSEGQPYTVFAPTNEAFAKLDASHYPCFYAPQCKAQVADILRRHIVPGEKHLSDMNPEGGVYSMFSIDKQHVVGGQPAKDQFTVDGQKVLSENQLLGGELYEINGVLATDRDLVQFEAPIVVGSTAMPHEPGTDLPPHVAAGKVVTITSTDATTPIPY
jgi:uncharacterized surface protein with fasciclin (FAS1) repeats